MSGRVPGDLLARLVADGAPAWEPDTGPRVVPDLPDRCGARGAVEWLAFAAGVALASWAVR